MNFSQNEPNSAPISGIGSIRTMQGDLKNIRASKGRQLQQNKESQPQTNKVIGPFVVSKENEMSKKEQLNGIIKENKQSRIVIEQKKPIKIENEEVKEVQSVKKEVVIPKKSVIQVKPEIRVKPEIKINKTTTEKIEGTKAQEAVLKTDNESKIQERIKQMQTKIKPFSVHKDVSAPENIIKVAEPENKAAAQYVASLSKSAQEKNRDVNEKQASEIRIDEEEYLPPELRLYRSSRNSLSALKRDSLGDKSQNKSRDETGRSINNVHKSAMIADEEKKPASKFKFVIIIAILLISAYFLFIEKIDLSFVSKWFPIVPKITPVLLPTPSPIDKKINISNIIYIKNPVDLKGELLNIKDKQYSSVNLISVSSDDAPLAGELLLEKLNIIIPENLKNTININNVNLLYFATDNRLGLAFEIKENSNEDLLKEIITWEDVQIGSGTNPMTYSFSPLLLGNYFELGQSIIFNTSNYKGISINYANLPDSGRSIDFAIINNFLVIVTSKDDMILAINEITK